MKRMVGLFYAAKEDHHIQAESASEESFAAENKTMGFSYARQGATVNDACGSS
jgi:hypothetical protein